MSQPRITEGTWHTVACTNEYKFLLQGRTALKSKYAGPGKYLSINWQELSPTGITLNNYAELIPADQVIKIAQTEIDELTQLIHQAQLPPNYPIIQPGYYWLKPHPDAEWEICQIYQNRCTHIRHSTNNQPLDSFLSTHAKSQFKTLTGPDQGKTIDPTRPTPLSQQPITHQ